LNERFEQYINGKRENLHSNFTLRLKKILWEARSTPTLVVAENEILKLDQLGCKWSEMEQQLKIAREIFVAMLIPDTFKTNCTKT
jgi:hypothetical protein